MDEKEIKQTKYCCFWIKIIGRTRFSASIETILLVYKDHSYTVLEATFKKKNPSFGDMIETVIYT